MREFIIPFPDATVKIGRVAEDATTQLLVTIHSHTGDVKISKKIAVSDGEDITSLLSEIFDAYFNKILSKNNKFTEIEESLLEELKQIGTGSNTHLEKTAEDFLEGMDNLGSYSDKLEYIKKYLLEQSSNSLFTHVEEKTDYESKPKTLTVESGITQALNNAVKNYYVTKKDFVISPSVKESREKEFTQLKESLKGLGYDNVCTACAHFKHNRCTVRGFCYAKNKKGIGGVAPLAYKPSEETKQMVDVYETLALYPYKVFSAETLINNFSVPRKGIENYMLTRLLDASKIHTAYRISKKYKLMDKYDQQWRDDLLFFKKQFRLQGGGTVDGNNPANFEVGLFCKEEGKCYLDTAAKALELQGKGCRVCGNMEITRAYLIGRGHVYGCLKCSNNRSVEYKDYDMQEISYNYITTGVKTGEGWKYSQKKKK